MRFPRDFAGISLGIGHRSPSSKSSPTQHFRDALNAYLTLSSDQREEYDSAISPAEQREERKPPHPLDALTEEERSLLMARIALWRRDISSALHLLRVLLENSPDYAPGWALQGEVFYTIERVEEGIHAYEQAVTYAPENTDYFTRLQHGRDALAGKVVLTVELSPEEESLREERRSRGTPPHC